MALAANGQGFCKVIHTENGRTTTRRIHTMMIQATDGRCHYLSGESLPDSISLFSGIPYRGAHIAEVLLNPKKAQASPLIPESSGWLSKRDVFVGVLGVFIYVLTMLLAEAAASALS
ncbi:hypothetical protein [Novipirellula artificiosorum]|uniref:Uncharacterized protein n=1 Tax=Novipirellula artificiosorum TaxID=2528016 RepID=A0A5C6DDQ8_9BACT|nr:hypothetical protein [Novipirellula artificiosorum]TWU34882.1 hypothetical protein Poly41_40250 [Novipirellula artificiosorum]